MNQPAHPLGEIVRHSNGATSLRFERELARPPERVWRALAESDQLRHWMPCDIVGSREAGAEVAAPFWDDVVAKYGIEDTVLTGRIVTWRPPSTFAWEWDDELLTYQLEPTPAGHAAQAEHRSWNQGPGRASRGRGLPHLPGPTVRPGRHRRSATVHRRRSQQVRSPLRRTRWVVRGGGSRLVRPRGSWSCGRRTCRRCGSGRG